MYKISVANRVLLRQLVKSKIRRVEISNQSGGKLQERKLAKAEEKTPIPSSTSQPATKVEALVERKPHVKTLLSTKLDIQDISFKPQLPKVEDVKALLDVNKQQELALMGASKFDDMPGPRILKALARAWGILPQMSNQLTAAAMVYFTNMLGRIDDHSEGGASLVWNRGVAPFAHMFEKYGPVVRLQGVFGGDIVFVARPEHIEAVYREEGKYPLRSTLDSLEKYREEHRKQSIGGPFVIKGRDWETVRSKIEKPFKDCVSQYSSQLETIADDFIENLPSLLNRQDEAPNDFQTELFKWSFECVALVTLGRRMYLVGPHKLQTGSVGLNLFEAVLNASKALRKCESGFQMWRVLSTPSWSNLKRACQTIDSIILKFISETENCIQSRRLGLTKKSDLDALEDTQNNIRPVPLLESLMVESKMASEDVLTVLLDMLLLGTNATAHAFSFLLYRMAKNPRVQRVLFNELIVTMPEASSRLSPFIKGESFEDLKYLKACLRESLRMNPPIPVLTRILPKDIVLHNYRVPKGTLILMTTHVAAVKEENFEEAKKFNPDRWFKMDSHPFASLPYGHGPRSCVARHLADVQIMMLAAKVFRKYIVEYNYGTMQPTNRLIALPNKPLKFSFISRF